MVRGFLGKHPGQKLKERFDGIRKSEKFISSHKFSFQQEYTPEYMAGFHSYLQARRIHKPKQRFRYTPKKEVVFRKVSREQVDFFRQMM